VTATTCSLELTSEETTYMANYYASCRSNYFNVKNDEAFIEAMSAVPSIELCRTKNGFAILGSCPDGSGWPSWAYDEETDTDIEIDLPDIVSKHLVDNDVAIFMESGAEKLRYISGWAEAINNKGERKSISLSQIYDLAAELGTSVTHAEY
jgi:hypothetical protein